jgi:hypothetical protein
LIYRSSNSWLILFKFLSSESRWLILISHQTDLLKRFYLGFQCLSFLIFSAKNSLVKLTNLKLTLFQNQTKQFQNLEQRVPKPGTTSSKTWNNEFQNLEQRVPKPGTTSSKTWNNEFRNLEQRVTK